MKLCFSRIRPYAAAICLLMILFTLGFIWGNSIESTQQSTERSEEIVEEVNEIVEKYTEPVSSTPAPVVTNHMIRKMAHFTEFFLLGSETFLLLWLIKKIRVASVLYGLLFGLGAASIDETIQVFTGRGPQISDVFLDFCGYFTGFLVFAAIRGCVCAGFHFASGQSRNI